MTDTTALDATPEIELFQFWHSHYNEKVRWALDYKGIEYTPIFLVPGFHFLRGFRVSGQASTPYIRRGDEVTTGSTAIVRQLDAMVPADPLFPAVADPAFDAWMSWFDDVIGPAVRRSAFFEMMPHKAYFTRSMARTWGPMGRAMYRMSLPGLQWAMRRMMNIYAEPARACLPVIEEGLDRVAALGDGYAFEGRFTAADLTAASLLYPMAQPPEGPAWPEPRPAEFQAYVDRWADHPGAEWVKRIFRQHRLPSARSVDEKG